MQARDYFPLGMATGKAFCNRKQETELLIENINSCKHTLLMAPRRYGKSSLALHSIELSSAPYQEVDFYMARSEKVIEAYILNGITELIGKALGSVDKLIAVIKRHAKNLNPKINIGTDTIKLELTAAHESDPATNVKEGLQLIESLLEGKKKRAILLFDEFQNVGLIAKGSGIEAAIRHAAQKTKYLTFIFSGSNRRLLKCMFEDDTRPLYKLCWKIDLARISQEHYNDHLQKAALLAWQQKLSAAVINEIITITERHPYYMNKLCDKLWTYYKNKPPTTTQDVAKTWETILEEEKSDAIKEISALSLGQKAILLQITKNKLSITSKQSMLESNMASSSIVAALEALQEKDIIEKIDQQYSIINPIVKFYAAKG